MTPIAVKIYLIADRFVHVCRVCDHSEMDSPDTFISTDPLRRGGRPCVRDLRISVGDVLHWLASGMSTEQIVADYPELTAEDVRACLAYAAAREVHEPADRSGGVKLLCDQAPSRRVIPAT